MNRQRATAVGRLRAFEFGFPPTEVWRTFRQFEDDLEYFVEAIRTLEAEAKPILEERERAKK